MLKKTSNFSRSQTGDKTKKIFLYLITELKIYHLELEYLRLTGRASQSGIRKSEVQFLMETK